MCNKRAYLLENSKNILDNITVDDDLIPTLTTVGVAINYVKSQIA